MKNEYNLVSDLCPRLIKLERELTNSCHKIRSRDCVYRIEFSLKRLFLIIGAVFKSSNGIINTSIEVIENDHKEEEEEEEAEMRVKIKSYKSKRMSKAKDSCFEITPLKGSQSN